TLKRIALQRLNLTVEFLPLSEMPPPGAKPFFSLLDQSLSEELRSQVRRPFWLDTVGRSSWVEIRIQLDTAIMRVLARRNAAYASSSGIVLFWMVGWSSVWLLLAFIFLRNQIKPILRLADAAEGFGKGSDVPNFAPRRAREGSSDAAAALDVTAH